MSKLFEQIYKENNLKLPLFERILREEHLREMANGQPIPTNAMTDYKKQGLSFEQIVREIEHKLNNPDPNSKLELYKYTTAEQFSEDYDAIYGNEKSFNTPLGIQAHMGANQKAKLLEKDKGGVRTKFLYAFQFVLEDPTVIIWERAPVAEHSKGYSGTLIFAKPFYINSGVKVINTVTINRNNMRVGISNFIRKIHDFSQRFLNKDNQIVYVKK